MKSSVARSLPRPGPAAPPSPAGAAVSTRLEPAAATPVRRSPSRWLVRLVVLVGSILRACGRVQIFSLASSLAFLSVTAIVPVATVILLVMASVPAFAEMRDQLQAFLAANFLLPQVADQVMGYINDFAAAAGRLSVVGTVAFVATAFTTMLTVDHALNEIWGSPEPRPIVYRLLIYWAALTVGPIVLAAVIALRIEDILSNFSGSTFGAPTWLPWLLMTLLLALTYHVLPNRRVRLVHALIGGAVAALLIEGLKTGLQYYITAYPTYQVVYGAFSVLPVLLLWVYIAWFAVLLGALVAANLGYPELALDRGASPGREFSRARVVVDRLLVAAAHGRGVRVRAFAALMDRDPATARRVGQGLMRLGYLVRVAPGAVADADIADGFGPVRPVRDAAIAGADLVDARGADVIEVEPAGGEAVDGVDAGTEVSAEADDDSGAVPAREIWAEVWMATPRLGDMTLRRLFDDIWAHGRLDEAPRPHRRLLRWEQRMLAEQIAAPALSVAPPPAAALDRPLADLIPLSADAGDRALR